MSMTSTEVPYILDLKKLWEHTTYLDDNIDASQLVLDDMLSKIFWNPFKMDTPQDYEIFVLNLKDFIKAVSELQDTYQNIFNMLTQYYPEAFTNGPK